MGMAARAWHAQVTSIHREEINGQDISLLLSRHGHPHAMLSAAVVGANHRDGSGGGAAGGGAGGRDRSQSPPARPDSPPEIVGVLRQALAGERCACFDLEMRSRVHSRLIQLQVWAASRADDRHGRRPAFPSPSLTLSRPL